MNHGVMEHIQTVIESSPEEIKMYTSLFKEFCNVFSWSYEEIP